MTFWHQFSLLWLVAWAALAFFTLSVCWLIISAAWRLSREESAIINEELKLWNSGGVDAPIPLPKEPMAMRIAKMMALGAVILGAYDAGTHVSYSREYAAWKASLPKYENAAARYQQDYAAWRARSAKENK